MTVNNTLRICLEGLSDERIQRLQRHITKGTEILCGCDQAGDYFVFHGRSDPVMLACFEDKYPVDTVTYHDLHPTTQEVYATVAECVPDSGYANALQELTQWDVKQVIRDIAKRRGL